MLRKVTDGVVFECFEASPLASAVMGSKASLRRSFPGRAIRIPVQIFIDPKFIDELSSFVHRLDSEQVDMVRAKSTKAGSKVVEERDSSNPMLVTELLTSILAPYGDFVKSRSIEKRTRDDVCWNNARLPWRRSPLWLVVKVAIELFLVNSGLDNAAFQFKNYMISLIAKLSQVARMHRLSSELLFVINAKAARRASKMANEMFDFVKRFTLDSVRLTREQIEGDVLTKQKADSVQTKIIVPSFTDRALRLTASTPYLTEALQRQLRPIGKAIFSSSASFRLVCPRGNLPSFASLSVSEQYSILVLADFEAWVRDNLKQWLQRSEDIGIEWADTCESLTKFHKSGDCQTLKELISSYASAATKTYRLHPEYLSLMLLTIMELWISLDILITGFFPLLKSYSPEVPTSILKSLLLPRREQLARLKQIETYLERRHRQVTSGFPSVFGKINNNSFSVQYFNDCKELQDLGTLIKNDAEKAKENKRQELEMLTTLQINLEEQVKGLEHSFRIDRRGNQYHDGNACQRCRKERQARELQISVYEWPLPDSQSEAKAAVFELRCPT